MLKLDLKGKKFGRLTALEEATGAEKKSYTRWLCVCDCGKKKYIARTSLTAGVTQSCGCLQVEGVKARRTTHGKSRTPEYQVWKNMMSRCYDPNNISYPNYGYRGIAVCLAWHEFENFLSDMGERPENHTIERVNNNGGYNKSNCKWATKEEQFSNTRRNHYVVLKGEKKTVKQLSKQFGISQPTLAYRLKNWKSLTTILNAPRKYGHTPKDAN